MNTFDSPPDGARPLGFWLRTLDAMLDRTFAEALAAEDVSRRDWMLLNVVDGTIDAPWVAERLARRSGRVRRLVERGWITESGAGWTLTDDGRAAKERLTAIVDGIRSRVAGAVSDEDYATTLRTLETLARELGWDESMREPRHPHARHGFGGGHAHGFAPRFGPGGPFARHGGFRGHGFGPHCSGHAAPEGDDLAFERGFVAGFERGRTAASESAA